MRPISQHLDAGLVNAARAITKDFTKLRANLPDAGNNRSPYPTDPYARYVHKEMIAGRSVAVLHLLTTLSSACDDGVSFADAMAPLRALERVIEARYLSREAKAQRQSQVIPLYTRCTRKRGPFDVANIRVGCVLADGQVTPDELPVLAEAVEKGREVLEATQDYVGALESTLAIHAGDAPARRLEMMR